MSSNPEPRGPVASWRSPEKTLEQLREVDKSLRRCYIVQTLICLVFLYFFYNTVGAARELENLNRQAAHCACVRDEFAHAQAFVAALAGERPKYQSYLDDLHRAIASLQRFTAERRIPELAVPPREVADALQAYSGAIAEALKVADKLGQSTLAEFSLDELVALTRSVRPLTKDERTSIVEIVANQPSALLREGRAQGLLDLVPPDASFPRSSCPSAAPTPRAPPAPGIVATSADASAERLAAMATAKAEFGGQKRLTANDLEMRRQKLQEDHDKLAREAQLAKTKLPVVDQEMELSLAFRLGPIALFFTQLLIAAYFRQRAALVSHLSQTFDEASVEQRAAKARLHLFLLPWVLNFPLVRVPNFEGGRLRGARITRAVLWGLAFLPVLTIALILFRPLYFRGTRGRIADPGAMSGVDVLFICLSVVFLVLTLLQVLDTRRLDRRVSEALAWTPLPAPVPPALAESPGRRELRFALWAILALLSNCSYAVTREIRVDLSVVLPIIVLFVAYRFGKTRAWVLGMTIVGLYAVPRLFEESLPWWELVYRRAWAGPLYIPHSSVADAVRLGLLGYCGGWVMDRLPSMLRERPDWLRAWARSAATIPAERTRALAVGGASAAGILLANVIFRFSFVADGEQRAALVPLTGGAAAASAAVGWWLVS